MKNILHHVGKGISSGTFIGLIIAFSISWQVGTGKFYPSTPSFMAQFDTELEALGWSIILWSVIGLMFTFASLIYQKNNWSIVKQSSIHFTCTYLGLLSLNMLLHWFDYTLSGVIKFTLIFIGIYVIVTVLSMIKIKMSVDEINQRLNERGESNE